MCDQRRPEEAASALFVDDDIACFRLELLSNPVSFIVDLDTFAVGGRNRIRIHLFACFRRGVEDRNLVASGPAQKAPASA